MLTTTYPAKPSYFVNEDAIIRRYRFWDELKTLVTCRCYPFQIVYNDGLISYVASDGASRTAYGILLGSCILPMRAPTQEMTVGQAIIHCKKVIFAQHKSSLPSIEILRYMRSHKHDLNKVLYAFDGDLLQDGAYISDMSRGANEHAAINFTQGQLFQCSIDRNKEEKGYCRPIIDITGLG